MLLKESALDKKSECAESCSPNARAGKPGVVCPRRGVSATFPCGTVSRIRNAL